MYIAKSRRRSAARTNSLQKKRDSGKRGKVRIDMLRVERESETKKKM